MDSNIVGWNSGDLRTEIRNAARRVAREPILPPDRGEDDPREEVFLVHFLQRIDRARIKLSPFTIQRRLLCIALPS
jgi:hypothetical protein